MAVDCISHCVSIEAPFLTTVISPFLYSWNTAVNLPLASQSAYPVLTEEQDLSFSLSFFFFFASYLHIYYYHIYLHMLLVWADKWTICTCKKKKKNIKWHPCVLWTHRNLFVCSTFTELSCKLMMFSVQTYTKKHAHTHTLSDTPLWWQPCYFLMAKMYFNYI